MLKHLHTMIPKCIYQTWKTHDLSPTMANLVALWKTHNPDYEHKLFDNAECDEFIKKHFDRNVYVAYSRIIPGALKADMWRYCVLYVNGGVYADIDTMCMNSLNKFVKDREFVTAVDLNATKSEGEHNLFNSIIASIPGHPILKGCIDRITRQVLTNTRPSSLLDIAGPGVLGREFNLYLGRNETDSVLGMEGSVNDGKILFLQFQSGIEYVLIKGGDVLLQNKNGNPDIAQSYSDDCRSQKIVSWLNSPPWTTTGIMYEQYLDLDRRKNTFIKSYQLIKDMKNPLIVELGTTRSFVSGCFDGCLSTDLRYWKPHNPEVWDWGAGIFTKVFADTLGDDGYTMYSIDPSPEAVTISKTMLAGRPCVHVIQDYSTNFLKQLTRKIDFLYMDHMESGEAACLQHLEDSKLIVEKDLMAPGAIILVDDVGDNITLTKGKFSIPYLLEHGYEMIMHEYQVLLRRK